MQEKKYFLVVVNQEDGRREQRQKHLILCNLKEVFEQFRSKNPQTMVGFFKCAELRP